MVFLTWCGFLTKEQPRTGINLHNLRFGKLQTRHCYPG